MSLTIDAHGAGKLQFGRIETVGETRIYVATHADFDYRKHTFTQLFESFLAQKHEIEDLDEDVLVFFVGTGAALLTRDGAEIFLRSRVLLLSEFLGSMPEGS